MGAILSIINPSEKFIFCLDKDKSVEIRIKEDDMDYETLQDGIDKLNEEATYHEDF